MTYTQHLEFLFTSHAGERSVGIAGDIESRGFSITVAPFSSGKWELVHSGHRPVAFNLRWSDVDPRIVSSIQDMKVMVAIKPYSWSDPLRVSLAGKSTAISDSGSYTYEHGSNSYPHGSYKYVARIEWTMMPTVTSIATSAFASRHLGLLMSPHHNNVRFIFPRDGARELWANAELLAATSPYLKLLFNSGFSESSALKVKTPSKSVVIRAPLQFEDSDDDEALAKPVTSSSSGCSCAGSHHEVEIMESSFITYKAVLCWLYTGFIDFAPLSSTFSNNIRRAKALFTMTQRDLALPTPASPKSIYRLSHLLELPKLQELALQAIKSQLTDDNVLEELFSETSGTFDEVMELSISFVIANREKIRERMNWAELSNRLGELPWGGKIAFKLMESGL
ncbi:hypothetical protein P7C70_g5962, partial [Phenoliferia sp. Uapishka_3]